MVLVGKLLQRLSRQIRIDISYSVPLKQRKFFCREVRKIHARKCPKKIEIDSF